jgi:pheromone shutdown protein TraB
MRYPILFAAHGGASVITFDQIAQTVVQDYLKRTAFIGQLNFNYLAAELALAGMPVTSAGSRQTFTTEVTQSVMKLAAEDALDSDTFADAVNNVLQRFRHVQPT